MAKRGSRALPLGLVMIGLSIVSLVVGIISLVSLLGSVFDAEAQPVPGTFSEELEPNEYLVAVEILPGVTVDSVVVTGPDGAELPLRGGGSQTITRNTQEFDGQAVFDADVAGTYTVTVNTNGPTEAIVTRSLTGLDGGDALGLGLFFLGILLFVLGAILVIVGLVRRRNKGPGNDSGGPGAQGWQPPASPSSYGQPNPDVRYQGPSAPENPYS